MREQQAKTAIRFKFIKTTDPEYADERMLRWEVLRKPLGMPPGSELLPEDPTSYHLVALEKKAVVGCVLFHPDSENSGRIFQLALGENHQAQGFGRKLVHALEEFLIKNGYNHIYCYAREESQGFFQNMGFVKEDEEVILHGITHFIMKKDLISCNYEQV